MQGSLSKGKCCNYPKARKPAAAARPDDSLRPGRRLPLWARQQVFLGIARSPAASEGARWRRAEPRRAARSWRASGSPPALPQCQPDCGVRSPLCDRRDQLETRLSNTTVRSEFKRSEGA